MYICKKCNIKTENCRPWLYERKKRNIRQEATAVEHESVDSQELTMTHEVDPLASPRSKSPQDDFEVFTEADTDSETTTSFSSEDSSDSDASVEPHHWSHDLVLCTTPEAVSLPVSLEGRVISLEENLHDLQEQTKYLQGSMTKLETQLERMEQLLRTAHVALGELAYLIGE